MSEKRRVQSPLPGHTSITIEPASARANRINSELLECFIRGSPKQLGYWKTLIRPGRARTTTEETAEAPSGWPGRHFSGAISDGRETAVDRQLHPIHEARIV